jgi:hypothetical protein
MLWYLMALAGVIWWYSDGRSTGVGGGYSPRRLCFMTVAMAKTAERLCSAETVTRMPHLTSPAMAALELSCQAFYVVPRLQGQYIPKQGKSYKAFYELASKDL